MQHQCHQDQEPGHVEPGQFDHGGQQGQDDQHDLEPVEEETGNEHHQQHHQHQAGGAQAQAFEELGDQLVATDQAQHIGKHRGANEDGEDEAGGEGGLNTHLTDDGPAQLTVGCGQQDGAKSPQT